jgi:hypothetical protein
MSRTRLCDSHLKGDMAPRVYTASFRRRHRLIAISVTMAAGVAPFMVVLAAMQYWTSPPPYALALLTAATYVAAGLAPWYSRGTLALLGNWRLKHEVLKIANADLGDSVDGIGAVFAGFSPGEKLRLWDGDTDRDVGFLAVRNDCLIYLGDEYKWSLPRSQIDQIELAAADVGLRRIVVRWHRPREAQQAFSLVCREANTLQGVALVTRRLYETLRDWAWGQQPASESAAVDWGYPPTDVSGGLAADQPVSGSCVSVAAIMVVVVLTIWRISGTLLADGDYYAAILWAGLIAVIGAIFTGYLLHYLHSWEAQTRHRGQRTR